MFQESYSNYGIPYSGKVSRTINFAVFEDFAAASKINSSKSYYVTEYYGQSSRSSKFNLRNLSWRDNLEIFLPRKLPAICSSQNIIAIYTPPVTGSYNICT